MDAAASQSGEEEHGRAETIVPYQWIQPSVRTVERIALGVTAVCAGISVTFVLLYWFQQQGQAVGLYEQFMRGGRLFDLALGTNTFQYPSVWQSIAAALLAGIAVPLVGTFMVHRQQALIGETLAHTAFAGVAIGIVVNGLTPVGLPLEVFALVVAVVGALGLQRLTERIDSYGDVPLAIVLVGSFAVGTLLMSYADGRMPVAIDIEAFLFGSPAVVTVEGTRLMAGVAVAVVGTVALFYKQLLFVTFDSPAARAARIDVSGFNTLLIVLTAVVVVGAMQVLGVILVAGLLVVPVAAASQIARRFRELLLLSILLGQVAVAVGLFWALVLGLPSGGMIISVAIGCYLLALAASNKDLASIAAK